MWQTESRCLYHGDVPHDTCYNYYFEKNIHQSWKLPKELQGRCIGSRLWRGLVAPSQFKAFLTASIR